MPNTTYGTPFVASSDLVSAYPGVSSTLATRLDNVSLLGNGVNAQTTSYTLVLADGGKTVTMTNAGATTLTVPTDASVAFPTGVGVVAINLGAGTMTVAGAGGVTVNGASLAVAQYEAITLRKTAANTWVAVKGGGLPKATYSATTGSPSVTTVSGKTCLRYTGSGSITISAAGVLDVLVVAGGGGGGNFNSVNGGGGGAGGYVYRTSLYVPASTINVVVGAGGAAEAVGNTSYLENYVYAIGGGRGHTSGYFGDGASAGQLWGRASQQVGQGSIGATLAAGISSGTAGNVGGGGSSANGSGTTGGAGTSNSITGSAVTYAAGGSSGTNAAGGANTGNGGGGGTAAAGASGGSGVVILLIG